MSATPSARARAARADHGHDRRVGREGGAVQPDRLRPCRARPRATTGCRGRAAGRRCRRTCRRGSRQRARRRSGCPDRARRRRQRSPSSEPMLIGSPAAISTVPNSSAAAVSVSPPPVSPPPSSLEQALATRASAATVAITVSQGRRFIGPPSLECFGTRVGITSRTFKPIAPSDRPARAYVRRVPSGCPPPLPGGPITPVGGPRGTIAPGRACRRGRPAPVGPSGRCRRSRRRRTRRPGEPDRACRSRPPPGGAGR